jgi:hypothetical protein
VSSKQARRGLHLAMAGCIVLLSCGCGTAASQLSTQTPPLTARPASTSPESPAASRPTQAATRVSPKGLCDASFPQDELIAWADGTVGSFRSFQYGGPTPTIPLASVYPRAGADTDGAWCLISSHSDQPSGWWVVIAGERPVLALRDSKPLAEWRGKVAPPTIP